MLLTPREAKQIEFQRKFPFARYEINVENSEPVNMVNIRECIKL